MGEGTKELLDTRESIICSETLLARPILTLVKSALLQHSTNLIFKLILVQVSYFDVCMSKKCYQKFY